MICGNVILTLPDGTTKALGDVPLDEIDALINDEVGMWEYLNRKPKTKNVAFSFEHDGGAIWKWP